MWTDQSFFAHRDRVIALLRSPRRADREVGLELFAHLRVIAAKRKAVAERGRIVPAKKKRQMRYVGG